MNPIDTFVQRVDVLTTAVQGLQAENAALQSKVAELQAANDAYASQDQEVVDATAKVDALTDSITAPPPSA